MQEYSFEEDRIVFVHLQIITNIIVNVNQIFFMFSKGFAISADFSKSVYLKIHTYNQQSIPSIVLVGNRLIFSRIYIIRKMHFLLLVIFDKIYFGRYRP